MEQYSDTPAKSFLSVGIDVGADFSWMSIALPDHTSLGKPFKILHSDQHSLEQAVSKIKEAEEGLSLGSRVFLESTSIYHYPLFRYFSEKGFDCAVINPIITKSSTNFNIRKVHNDKIDSKKIAFVGLNPGIKTSIIPSDAILDIRNLEREYYHLRDCQSGFVNKLSAELRMAFPQFLQVFPKVSAKTPLKLLKDYPSPQAVIDAPEQDVTDLIRKTGRIPQDKAALKCQKLRDAAAASKIFGHFLPSNKTRIKSYISMIESFEEQIGSIMQELEAVYDKNRDTDIGRQIDLVQSFIGAGFLSAATLVGEIGDFKVFQSPRQLYAYFGLDPAVKQSGKFEGTRTHMSKRGSRVARRALHIMAVNSIAIGRDKKTRNPVLREYYLKKCQAKPKMQALVAVMHKVCNIIFAILRDGKLFRIITPEEHRKAYRPAA